MLMLIIKIQAMIKYISKYMRKDGRVANIFMLKSTKPTRQKNQEGESIEVQAQQQQQFKQYQYSNSIQNASQGDANSRNYSEIGVSKSMQSIAHSNGAMLKETDRCKSAQDRTASAIATLGTIQQWRKHNIAPVDTVGCEMLHDKNQPIHIQKYQTLIALILSVQTKDQTTGKVMQRLKQYGLNPGIMAEIQQEKLTELIRESNFNRRKTKSIIEVSKRVRDHGLPKTKQQLMEYPGVGTKIALLYMRVAEGANEGIGVDTHVHRISNRLGWVKNTKDPVQTQKQLQKLFPPSEWHGINIALVGFGQRLCSAKKPQCQKCPVNFECPSSKTKYKYLF